MIDQHNVLAQSYRATRDRYSSQGLQGVRLRLIKNRNTDGRTYNLPNTSEIAGLIVGDFDTQEGFRDIIVETQSKRFQRISELHPLVSVKEGFLYCSLMVKMGLEKIFLLEIQHQLRQINEPIWACENSLHTEFKRGTAGAVYLYTLGSYFSSFLWMHIQWENHLD